MIILYVVPVTLGRKTNNQKPDITFEWESILDCHAHFTLL